jgi:hypothetical protein
MMSRICPNVGQVLDPQTIDVQVVVPDGLVASGPSQLQFGQQVGALLLVALIGLAAVLRRRA